MKTSFSDSLLLSMLFVGALLSPALLQIFGPESAVVKTELRAPAALPAWPRAWRELASWPRQWDRYINDRFGGRTWLIRLNSRARLALGESGSPEVLVGRDGWLFLARDGRILDRYRGLVGFTPEQLTAWVDEMGRRAEWLRSRGIDIRFVIVPDKSTIYGGHLPSAYFRVGPTPTDQLCAVLQMQKRVPWLDLRPVVALAARSEQIYDRLDTHWNDRGSYIAYRTVMRGIVASHSAHVVASDEVEFERVCRSGDLARLLNLDDVLTEETCRARLSGSSVLGAGEVPDFPRFQAKGYRATTSRTNVCSAVILCDSYVMGSMVRFLRESFSVAEFRHHEGMKFPTRFIERVRPDIVIYLVVERLIPLVLPPASLPEDGCVSGVLDLRSNQPVANAAVCERGDASHSGTTSKTVAKDTI